MTQLTAEHQNLLGMLVRKYWFFKRNVSDKNLATVVRECIYSTCNAIVEGQGIRVSEASGVELTEVEGDYNGVPSWYRTLKFYNGDQGSFEYIGIDKRF